MKKETTLFQRPCIYTWLSAVSLCCCMAAVTSCDDLRLLSLLQDLSAAVISAWRKDEMRTKLKAVKKLVDDADRAKKNAMMQQVNKY